MAKIESQQIVVHGTIEVKGEPIVIENVLVIPEPKK